MIDEIRCPSQRLVGSRLVRVTQANMVVSGMGTTETLARCTTDGSVVQGGLGYTIDRVVTHDLSRFPSGPFPLAFGREHLFIYGHAASQLSGLNGTYSAVTFRRQ